MNAFYKNLNEDKALKGGIYLNLFLVFVSFFYIFINLKNLPPVIPLFNQLPWGDQRIIETVWILMLPTLSFIILVGNSVFSEIYYKKNPLIARLFIACSFMISILVFLFIIRTIQTVL